MSDDDDIEEMRRLRGERLQKLKNAMPKNDERPPAMARKKASEPGNMTDMDMSAVMGFGVFGKKEKKADTTGFEQTKRSSNAVSKNLPPKSVPDLEESDDEDMIGPPLPPGYQSNPASQGMEDDDSSEEEEEDDFVKKIPASHEIVLDHGAKTVSAVALDPSGARLVTGGYDYDVKFWDFVAMDSSLKSFRSFQPCESHKIKNLQYSNTGDTILIASGNCQAKVVDRDGFEVMECVRGDMYLVDMASTKGHVAMLNGACWNPKIKEEFITCSNDGTVRLWHLDRPVKHTNIIKFKSANGRKTIPTCCTFNRDGRLIAAACQDGTIQLWDVKRPFVRPTHLQNTAHGVGTDTSCLSFSYDNKVFASRGGDDTLKLWDLRSFKRPLNVAPGLDNVFPETDCAFSPDDKMIVTGISVRKGEEGKLLFLERNSFEVVSEISCGEASVVRCLWHPKLNQIIIGQNNGNAKILFDPDKSHRGAKLCAVKKKRREREPDIIRNTHIIAPLSMRSRRRRKEEPSEVLAIKKMMKDRADPIKSRRPEPPLERGTGGRAAVGGSTLAQYVAKSIALQKVIDDSNPREAFLRHAKDAEENPLWISPAYAQTQPKPIFADPESDEEADVEDESPGTSKRFKTN